MQSIGLLVPREKEPEFIACLENILLTKIVICDTKKPESTSARISETIITGNYKDEWKLMIFERE